MIVSLLELWTRLADEWVLQRNEVNIVFACYLFEVFEAATLVVDPGVSVHVDGN